MLFKQLLFANKICKKPFRPVFDRLLGAIAELSKINKENGSNIPTLYVPGKFGNDMYQIVKPNINLEYLMRNCIALQTSCNHRNIKIDINEVLQVCQQWHWLRQMCEANKNKFGEFKTSLQNDSTIDKESESIVKLDQVYWKEMTDSKQAVYDFEDIAMPLFAKIPNTLHENTPTMACVSECIQESKEFGFKVKSHATIAKSMHLLEFSDASPTAYYLIGKLACLEQAVQSYFENQLGNKGFVPISSVDFCKSFMIDACGKDPYNIDDCIILNPHGKEIGQRTNLAGASSFETFCAYFVNMNMDKLALPIKYYSSGRFYDANHRKCGEQSLFSTIQSNCMQCVIASEPCHADTCFNDLHFTLVEIFSLLNLPYRIVHVSAEKLNHTESRRIDIELWSPYLKKYIVCSNITQCDDFISNRLRMTYGTDFKTEGYLSIVHGFAVKIPILLGCIIENMQCEDGTYLVPDVLKENMFEL